MYLVRRGNGQPSLRRELDLFVSSRCRLMAQRNAALVVINALMLKRVKLTGIRRKRATTSPAVITPAMAVA